MPVQGNISDALKAKFIEMETVATTELAQANDLKSQASVKEAKANNLRRRKMLIQNKVTEILVSATGTVDIDVDHPDLAALIAEVDDILVS